MPKITFNILLAALVVSGLIFTLSTRQTYYNLKDEIPSSFAVSNVYSVAQVTGKNSLNDTAARYDVLGTDLGIMWDNGQRQVMVAFGDSYGQGWGECGAGPAEAGWRSNVLAFSSQTNPQKGLTFSGMIEDATGHAGELLPSRKVDGDEITVIPTAGISVGARNYLYFMSVNQWMSPGEWRTNYAGVAYSDDNGQTWTAAPGITWYNSKIWWDNKFQQASVVKDGGYVYMFGTPNGRAGDAYLARVEENHLLDKADYEYWDGVSWQLEGEQTATPVVEGPVGEISVQYNSYFKRWLMTYMDESRQAIVLRDAAALTGPWSAPRTVVNSASYPGLYGAFIHPWFNQGTDLYFNMSQWCSARVSYNVSFMHASLSLIQPGETAASPLSLEPYGPPQPALKLGFFPPIWKEPSDGDSFGGSGNPSPLNEVNRQVS